MADDFWKKFFDSSETLCTPVFKVAEYEFGIEIPKFKIVDPKWPRSF